MSIYLWFRSSFHVLNRIYSIANILVTNIGSTDIIKSFIDCSIWYHFTKL